MHNKNFSVTLVDEKLSIEPNGNINYAYMNGAGDPSKMGRCNMNEKQISWVDGIFNCMKPVLSLIGKSNIHDTRMRNVDDWEIPFEIISGENSFIDLKCVGVKTMNICFQTLNGLALERKVPFLVENSTMKLLR